MNNKVKTLYEFQEEGVSWILSNFNQRKGCLLAYDMGLGKTTVACEVVRKLFEKKNKDENFPILIVVPSSIIYSWSEEFENSCIKTSIFHSSSKTNLFEISDTDILITTYHTFALKREKIFKSMSKEFKSIIVDECALLKNNNTNIYIQLHSVIHRFKNRLFLSALPSENKPSELFNIFSFVQPDLLGYDEETFNHNIGDYIVYGTRKNASPAQKSLAFEKSLVLMNIIKPYILRKTINSEKKKLNKKSLKGDIVVWCGLNRHQRQLYDYEMGKKNNFNQEHRLRAIINGTCESIKPEHSIEKHKMIVKMIRTFFDENKSTVVFFKYRKVLEKINEMLKTFMHKNNIGIFHGGINSTSRKNIVKLFNKGEIKVLLMTSRSGGYGINLQKATKLIIAEVDYNPVISEQCSARSYRINQTKDVCIYRLVTKDTIEEKIYLRCIEKMNANKLVIGDNLDDEKNMRNICGDDKSFISILPQDFETSNHYDIVNNLSDVLKRNKSKIDSVNRKNKKKLLKVERKLIKCLRKNRNLTTEDLIFSFKDYCMNRNISVLTFKKILKKNAYLDREKLTWKIF